MIVSVGGAVQALRRRGRPARQVLAIESEGLGGRRVKACGIGPASGWGLGERFLLGRAMDEIRALRLWPVLPWRRSELCDAVLPGRQPGRAVDGLCACGDTGRSQGAIKKASRKARFSAIRDPAEVAKSRFRPPRGRAGVPPLISKSQQGTSV